MAKPVKKFLFRPDSQCPCGSGKGIASCHLDVDGRLRKPAPSLNPPGPPTGYSHAGCYLRGTADCSEQISREHYISRSVLDQLGQFIRVSGAPWQKPGEQLETSIGNLTAKILCKRHNEALSPLDDEAASFFSTLAKALVDLDRKTLSRKPIFHLTSGDALELWVLKVACGLYFSVGAKDRVKLTDSHTIDLQLAQRAFFMREWEPRAGLYFHGTTGSRITVANSVAISPLTDDQKLGSGPIKIPMSANM